jgi:hypothetical protein
LDDLHSIPDELTFNNWENIDLERNGSQSSQSTVTGAWGLQIPLFVDSIKRKLINNDLYNLNLYFSGDYTGYGKFDGWVREGWWDTPPENRTIEYTITGGLAIKDQGLDVVYYRLDDPTSSGHTFLSTAFGHIYDISMASATGNGFNTILGYRDNAFLPIRRLRGSAVSEVTTGSYNNNKYSFKIFTDGVAIANISTGNTQVDGWDLKVESGGVFPLEQNRDYEYEFGFLGILGLGAGKKMNHPNEKIKAEILNKMEHAISNININLTDGFGNFELKASSALDHDIICQVYFSDGVRKSYGLAKAINKWDLIGYEEQWYGTLNGLGQSDPNPHFARLSDYDVETGLFRSLEFESAPTSGWHFLLYRPTNGSQLNSAAYLGD